MFFQPSSLRYLLALEHWNSTQLVQVRYTAEAVGADADRSGCVNTCARMPRNTQANTVGPQGTFERLQRMITDQVRFALAAADHELIKSFLDQLSGPMGHRVLKSKDLAVMSSARRRANAAAGVLRPVAMVQSRCYP